MLNNKEPIDLDLDLDVLEWDTIEEWELEDNTEFIKDQKQKAMGIFASAAVAFERLREEVQKIE